MSANEETLDLLRPIRTWLGMPVTVEELAWLIGLDHAEVDHADAE